jgi:hypothetical protein
MDSVIEKVEIDVSDITLSDIEDNEVRLADFKGKTVVMAGAKREGADEARRWGKELSKKCESLKDVQYFRIAFVGKIPTFVPRRFIKGLLKGSGSTVPTLIAWDNDPAEKMGVHDSKTPYIFIIDPEGTMRFRFRGHYAEDDLSRILEHIPK